MNEKIGIIGGSGFKNLLEQPKDIRVNTPYGAPSAPLSVGKIGKCEVVFLPRHGYNHQYPPHKVPYQANIHALKELGVKKIITCTAVGSIQKKIKPGDIVIIDQFINLTKNRTDTFYNGPVTTHISTAFPYCPTLNRQILKTAKKIGIKVRLGGTVVVVDGPRFSTAAESSFFTNMGWDIINMTQYPEVTLARELGLCYTALALVTDYDAGVVLKNKLKPVTTRQVLEVFKNNNQKATELINETIKQYSGKLGCECRNVLKDAQI